MKGTPTATAAAHSPFPSVGPSASDATFSAATTLSVEEERDQHFRRDTESQALFQLECARTKPVAFAVKIPSKAACANFLKCALVSSVTAVWP